MRSARSPVTCGSSPCTLAHRQRLAHHGVGIGLGYAVPRADRLEGGRERVEGHARDEPAVCHRGLSEQRREGPRHGVWVLERGEMTDAGKHHRLDVEDVRHELGVRARHERVVSRR